MKIEQEFYTDTWDDMTKTHRTKALEFASDVWGWLTCWRAKKLKVVMDRSKLYWARKEAQKKRDLRRQKTELMLGHRRRYRELLREIREEAVREAKENVNA